VAARGRRGRWVEGEPKTKAGRRSVVVNRALADRLVNHLGDRLLDREGYVFAAPDGTRLNYGTFYSLHFKPGVAAVLPAHLHGLRFHDLRHSYASLLVMSDVAVDASFDMARDHDAVRVLGSSLLAGVG